MPLAHWWRLLSKAQTEWGYSMIADYTVVPESALIALAKLTLKRAKLESVPCTSQEQALRIIRGIKPAPPRRSPLNIKPCTIVPIPLCFSCHKPMPVGTLCDSMGRNHIECSDVTNVR